MQSVRYLSFASGVDRRVGRDVLSPEMRDAVRPLPGDEALLSFPGQRWQIDLKIHRDDGWATFNVQLDPGRVGVPGAIAWTLRGSRRALRHLREINLQVFPKAAPPPWLASLTAPPPWFGVAILPLFAGEILPSEVMWMGLAERAVVFAVLDDVLTGRSADRA
jgi:hypothetical protein